MIHLATPTDATEPSAERARELACQNETAPASCPVGEACAICHEPPGPDAPQAPDHESRVLARLAGIEGVQRPGEGVPLAQAFRDGPLDACTLLALALRLARIVAAVHRRGVLHRNISPASIVLVGAQRLPVLTGLHLATTVAEGHPGLIHQHDLQGTLAYLAPEQTGRTGRGVDHRTDLYALGATLYEAATGRPPFEARDPLQLIHDQLTTLPTPPGALAPALPRMLSAILLRLLEKEPSQRYQSAEGLAHDLARLIDQPALRDSGFDLGERDFGLRLSPPARLVGRERETGALRQIFDEVLQGRSHVVLVAGGAGVGKTSLVNGLRPMVTARHGWFVSGKFDQYRQDAPSATVQALRALGRLLLAEPAAELASDRNRILAALGSQAGLVAARGLPEYV
ncbi:MAG TPA: AAA family ATPase, partial [Ramlibacter sp.]|nr:AAA family ATPase [Ramlibacter sp.]